MAVATVGAVTGITLIKDIIKAGAEAAQTGVSMTTAGMTLKEIADVHASAKDLSAKFPIETQTEIEKMEVRARAVTGSTEHAIDAMPTLLKSKVIFDRETPGVAGDGFEQYMLRSAEIANAITDPQSATGCSAF